MNKEELLKIVSIIESCYPNRFGYAEKNKSDRQMFLETWFAFLKDFPYKLAEIAIYKLAAESKYPPSIHDILEKIEKIKNPNRLNADKAWKLVENAVGRFGRHNPREAFDNLPPIVVDTIKLFGGWDKVCNRDVNNSYSLTEFKNIFNSLMEEHITNDRLPGNIKEKIISIQEKNVKKSNDSKQLFLN
ncbi:MAG: replicative helicase loader/inhibitor [Candidatus Woesearchaeota archaeon]